MGPTDGPGGVCNFLQGIFYIYFRAQFFLNVSLVDKCISKYIYSLTIPIFEVEPYECQ